jgi:hypothetical protein
MKVKTFSLIALVCCALCSMRLSAQTFPFTKDKLVGVNVSMSVETLKSRSVVKVTKDSTVKEVDEPTFVRLKGVEFKDGTIEVMVLSKLQANAPELARGFIGVAFRINEDHSKFECIYIRPANGRDSNQVRRNHSIQYFSYPDYKFSRLRKEAPEQYESYADMGLNEWIKLKIVVKGQQAKLFINDSKEPALIVNDLKHGAGQSGAIGLWVDVGTEGFFSDLKISR